MSSTCDYAACPDPAAVTETGWHFCAQHYLEHRADLHGEQWPKMKTDYRIFQMFRPAHGTRAAMKAHNRAGEPMCGPCRNGVFERRTREWES